MRLWMVLGLVLLLPALVSQVRVGGEVDYAAGGLRVRIRLGPLRLTVYPLRMKKKKRPKRKKPLRGPRHGRGSPVEAPWLCCGSS